MNPTTATIIRSVLKIGAGWLVAKGYTDDSSAEVVIAGIIAGVGIVWGIIARRNTPAQ